VRLLERLGLQRAATPGPTLGGKTVIVGPGDTLRTIARREYGDEDMWERILQANPTKVKDAESLNIGTELRLP
jgi:nucleoid-associated protein YgaU